MPKGKGQRLRSKSPKRCSSRKRKSQIEFLAQGNEGKVYRHTKRNTAIKKFHSHISKIAFNRHVDFLKDNADSGVVPRLIRVSLKRKTIEMEYLSDYISLTEALRKIKKLKNESEIANLILALKSARAKLRIDYDYSDLSNFGNIAVKIEKQKIKVKFFEGGKAIPMQADIQSTVAELWLRKVVYEMKVSKNPIARAILSNKTIKLE